MRHFAAESLHAATADGHFRRMVSDGPSMRAGMLGFGPEETFDVHAHGESAELFYFVRGSARFDVPTRTPALEVSVGDLVVLEPREPHRFTAGAEGVVVLAVVAPNLDDTIREADRS